MCIKICPKSIKKKQKSKASEICYGCISDLIYVACFVSRGYSGSAKGETSPGSKDWAWGDDWVEGATESQSSSPVEEEEEKQWGDWGDEFSNNTKKTKSSKQRENTEEQAAIRGQGTPSSRSKGDNLIDFENVDISTSDDAPKTSAADSDWNNDAWANVEEDDEWQALEIESAKSRGSKAD